MTTPSRRGLLGALGGVAVGAALAGCIGAATPEEHPDAPDLMLRNCTDQSHTVALAVTDTDSGETVHDQSHDVPGGYCGDEGPSRNVEEVWTDPGEYRISATVEDASDAEGTVTLSESDIDGKTGTRTVRIDEDGTTIG